MTTNKIVAWEEAEDEGLFETLSRLEEKPDAKGVFRTIRGLFRLLLEGEFTEDEAGDLMDELGQKRAGELLGAAVRAAFPEATEKTENPKRPLEKA
ncbi:hypothetical protein [Rhodovulum sp. ES.010]|uniref:hypothetical protein n=1 Tax=Rhodovulum sp. ES.010 TaxID=1882821 RepID=UPI0011152E98|nr:hypothetical protein [Rhodovulum sp. ES.010]